jgi:hypothetical protein
MFGKFLGGFQQTAKTAIFTVVHTPYGLSKKVNNDDQKLRKRRKRAMKVCPDNDPCETWFTAVIKKIMADNKPRSVIVSKKRFSMSGFNILAQNELTSALDRMNIK